MVDRLVPVPWPSTERRNVALRLLADPVPVHLEPGDILWGNRLSSMQRVMVLSGDPWTHSAIVVRIGGSLRTVEMGALGCFSRHVDEFATAYRFVGHARPDLSVACRRAVAERAAQELEQGRLRYSWLGCAVVEAIALARRMAPTRYEDGIVRRGRRAAEAARRRIGPDAVTCSGFVVRCLFAACEACRPVVRWPARDRVPPFRGGATATDVRPGTARWPGCDDALAEVLTTPSDLWVADNLSVRSVVRPDLTTVLVDLTTRPSPSNERRCCMNPNPNPAS